MNNKLFTFLGTGMNSTFPNDSGTKPNMTVYCNLVGMALQNKMPWNALPFIIEGLTPTLEKSKEVNKFLLQELEMSLMICKLWWLR